jgi:hypothetical protein
MITMAIMVAIFLVMKYMGASNEEAALGALAGGAAAYYTIEPMNEDSIWGDTIGSWFGNSPPDPTIIPTSGPTSPDDTVPVVITNPDGTKTPGWVDAFGRFFDSAGNVLTSWGPTGTAGVILAGGAVSGGMDKTLKWVLIGGAAVLAVVLLGGNNG